MYSASYDWRDQHLPTWDDELTQLKKHGIELTAVWFPAGLNEQARVLLDGLFEADVREKGQTMTAAMDRQIGLIADGFRPR